MPQAMFQTDNISTQYYT